ncbi:MAG: SpoIIE family protein phosphatase [Chlamydiales bacterium]|nr:SpoIIE family protein phosphatase [Chlamydiales bacterium]
MTNETSLALPPSGSYSDHKITVLMIDDQAIIGEAVKRMLQDEEDIDFNYCQDPTQAIETIDKLKPTVILQDLVMPKITGLELVEEYRKRDVIKDIPVIVLSTKEEPKTKAKAFELGANDYIVKLPDKVELIARIRYHSSSYIHLLQRNEAHQIIVESQEHLLKELDKAATYVQSLLPEKFTGEVDAEWEFIPSEHLGGDSFGYHWMDDENLAIYLLDVCGHGIGAALLSVSAMNVLRAQTIPNVDFTSPKDVMEGLNRTFPMESNNNMFFTMWYGVYNKKKRELAYSSGGHPPAIYLKAAGGHEELTTPGLVIGGMPDIDFAEERIKVKKDDRLFIFSDGVFEIMVQKEGGRVWTYGELVEAFKEGTENNTKEGMVTFIINRIEELQGARDFEDDVSLVQFIFN